MSDDSPKANELFLSLVFSLQSAAWYQMGKIASPISGKIERDLPQAKMSIDLLIMLQEKTKGNLQGEEQQLLNSAVYNLQMNYVDELNREREAPPIETEPATEEGSEQASGEKSADGSGQGE
ncbi:MAG: DUF1844 domain-containing protein [candidate division Zixibacteria bacterium]|nr:DUF1844 domain-containing protein [candidate division Zixibacteria bacterium]